MSTGEPPPSGPGRRCSRAALADASALKSREMPPAIWLQGAIRGPHTETGFSVGGACCQCDICRPFSAFPRPSFAPCFHQALLSFLLSTPCFLAMFVHSLLCLSLSPHLPFPPVCHLHHLFLILCGLGGGKFSITDSSPTPLEAPSLPPSEQDKAKA